MKTPKKKILNKGILVGVIAIALIVGGVVVFMVRNGDKSNQKKNDITDQARTDETIETLDISHEQLLKLYQEEDKKIENAHASYGIDVGNYSELISFADYCFVGRVDDIEGVQTDSAWQKEAGMSGFAFTIYNVTVMKNIKNKIEEGTKIRILKRGGLLSDLKSFEVIEDDNIPEVNHYYIFTPSVQQDGTTLVVYGENSTVETNKELNDKAFREFETASKKADETHAIKPRSYKLKLDKIVVK